MRRVFHHTAASPISLRTVTPSGSHDLIPASPSDGALRKLTLVGQTTNVHSYFVHLLARISNADAIAAP